VTGIGMGFASLRPMAVLATLARWPSMSDERQMRIADRYERFLAKSLKAKTEGIAA
jgi:hypothetical protein